jgi:hypothetical protein
MWSVDVPPTMTRLVRGARRDSVYTKNTAFPEATIFGCSGLGCGVRSALAIVSGRIGMDRKSKFTKILI